MSKHLLMETICEDYNMQSLAGTGMNTIRKYSAKYADLEVGDKVTMHYRVDPEEPPFAFEELKVTAVAVADLDILLDEHAYSNHGPGPSSEELFKQIYGDTDGLFCAIYFK